MNPADILTALRADGFRLTAEGDRIRIEPGDRLTDEALSLVRANKPALLDLLRAGEVTELARLVRACGIAYAFTEDEHREALEIALADPDNALTCFRAIAAELRLQPFAGG